jgi:predicted TIM-barrel fold metal-dependent hydrolase
MGGDHDVEPSPDLKYMDNLPFGASDPTERLELLADERIERAILYPSIGLAWENQVTDPGLTYAYARAYNRWIADFCRDSGGRLVAVAHIPLVDVGEATKELDRAVADGCRGGFVVPFTRDQKPHGHPDNDPFWARAEALQVPITMHPNGTANVNRLYHTVDEIHWYRMMLMPQVVQQAFVALIASGVFDRFPTLTVGILESQAGWLPTLLDRMDVAAAEDSGKWFGTRPLELKLRPSEYFRRNCFISADPDEAAFAPNIERVGADRVVWATDFPHPDHPATHATEIVRLVGSLTEEARVRVLGQNAVDLYHLEPLS